MNTIQLIETTADLAEPQEGLDLSYLHTISGGDKDFEKDMLQSLSAEMGEKMAALHAAMQTGDVKSIRMQAHSLKNLANIVGVASLAEGFKNIEACEAAFDFVLQQYGLCERQWQHSKRLIEELVREY